MEKEITLQQFAHKYLDGLYDPRFSDDRNCSGWRQLKKMVVRNLEPTDENLQPFHPVLRGAIKRHWDSIKKLKVEMSVKTDRRFTISEPEFETTSYASSFKQNYACKILRGKDVYAVAFGSTKRVAKRNAKRILDGLCKRPLARTQ